MVNDRLKSHQELLYLKFIKSKNLKLTNGFEVFKSIENLLLKTKIYLGFLRRVSLHARTELNLDLKSGFGNRGWISKGLAEEILL
jgi:hypothetical protein